jgi:hypothetical protein
VLFAGCDLAEILRDSVGQASRLSPSVPVEIHAPQTLPAVVETEALAGVVRILVDNACRRTDPGLNVTVKAIRADEGIAVHVFERGMGTDHQEDHLDLARSLVAIHGGILWSEPLPAGGAKTSFVIPREPPALEGSERAAAIHSLEVLAQLEVSPAPEPQVGDEEPDEAIVDVWLLGEASDEPLAIVDVTDVPASPVLEEESMAAPWTEPDARRELATIRPDPEPIDSATEPVVAELSEPDPGPRVQSEGARQEEDAGAGSRRKRRRSRWGWRWAPQVTEPPLGEPVAAELVESPPISLGQTSKPDPIDEGPIKLERDLVVSDRQQPDPPVSADAALRPAEDEPVSPEEAGDVQGPDPLAITTADPGAVDVRRPVHHIPAPFVPDPLHPATQMLRALLLEDEQRGF